MVYGFAATRRRNGVSALPSKFVVASRALVSRVACGLFVPNADSMYLD